MKKKVFTLLTLLVLCVTGASAATSVPTKDTQIACKSFVQTTLLWTSSTNFATWYAEGWATSGKSSNWSDINSNTGKKYQIDPTDDSSCSATSVSGIGVKDDSDSKQLFLYVTNVTKIEAYFINSSGSDSRTAKVKVIGSSDPVESSEVAAKNASVKVTSGVLTASEKYLVQFNASADMVLYAVRFTAASASANVSVTIPSSGYATFSSANALDLSSVNAYIVSAVSSTSATLSAVTEAPANTGIIIQGTPGPVNIPVKASAEDVGTNKLNATVKPKTVADNEAYILSGGKFHPANEGTIPAGKAYLDATDVADAHELSLDFGNVTAINKVETTKQASSEYYNLAGQQVAQPSKGLYIVNGKKVIIN